MEIDKINDIEELRKKCREYHKDAISWSDRYLYLYNRDYKEIDEILEYLKSRKLDLQEAMSEQKGDKNLLLAAYDGAHGMVVEILDFINEKQDLKNEM